ncbi:MAG: T9SS type A sorting domain-containing protein [Ignavibacteriae bacterium]|nr:T9SS type A sorting domain-containing protein [Ignavibacteriota bacterium]
MDTNSFANKNTINSYNLLGDPATKLLLPSFPEFDIRMSDYQMKPVFPSLREQITLSLYPKNLGTRADSCKIRFQLLKNNISNRITDTVVRNFDFIDSLTHTFRIDSAGIYAMKIILDVDNWYTREIETNNSIIIPIPLKNISFVPLKPIDNSIVKSDSVIFVGINPNIDPKKYNLKLFVQFDTTASFNSPLSQTFFKVCDSGVVTKFKIRIPLLDTNVVYFWRTNSVINNTDTSGWTYSSRFLYSPNLVYDRKFSNLVYDTTITIFKKFASQYNQLDLGNTIALPDGIKLRSFTGDLFAQSWGGDPWEASYFRINGKEIFLLDPSLHWGGLNIIKVRKNDGAYVELKHFKFTDPTSSDSVINYLNTFNDKYVLMVVKSASVGVTDTLKPSLVNRFRDFGSTMVDSVNLKLFGDRWCFISYPTNSGYTIAEKYLGSWTDWAPAISAMTPQFQYDSGYVFHNLGPVAVYKNFSWNQIVYPNSSLAFDVFGIDKNNQTYLLYSNITSNNYFGLDTIHSYIYPNLLLKTKLTVDSLSGYNSPILKSLRFNYVPPAELISDNYSFIKSDSVVQEGDTVRISVKYYNVGFIGAATTINTWSASSPSGVRILKTDTINSYLSIDSSVRASVLINTTGLSNGQTPINIFFETKLKNTDNEVFAYNNTAITSLVILGDSAKPSLDVTYDGIKVQNGDFIQTKPVINAKYLDDSKMQIRDTSNIKVYLDTNYIPYYIGSVKNPDIDIIIPTNKSLQATVVYKPTLSDGVHDFMYVAYEPLNSKADTMRYLLTVNPEMRIYDLNTYPNPMKTHTNFIFNLSGSNIPNFCKIKIFTVAGRLVKTISFPANIGYNQVPWDGRDDDGDYMANGVYLYKMIIEGNSKKEAAIQKLVILK